MNKIYFPGGNTGEGFYNLFEGIIPPGRVKGYTYILKGGPGVGKNTLMKKASERALSIGLEVEEFRCASDPKSLDAIRIPEIGISVLDGTAPHSIDPSLPGVYQEILDLGFFKNRDKFLKKAPRLEKLFAENKEHYTVAYSLLKAASELKMNAIRGMKELMDIRLIHDFIMDFMVATKNNPPRKLFLEAISPDGYVSFEDTVSNSYKILSFPGISGEVILCEAFKLLYKCSDEVFMDPLIPTNPRQLLLKDSDLFFSCSKWENESEDFIIKPIDPYIIECKTKAYELIDLAIDEIHNSKEIHDKIEDICRDYVNYPMVDKISEDFLENII